jgi:hypothetical protein
MARAVTVKGDERFLTLLKTLLAEEGGMARVTTEIKKASRRVVPVKRGPPRLSKGVYEANQKHAREKTCVCGCGGIADSASRGRTLEHYEQFRATKLKDADPQGYDHFMQKKGLILPPFFNPERSFTDYEAELDWDAKRKSISA